MRPWSAFLLSLALWAACLPARGQAIKILGQNTNDQFTAAFWAQNRNASNLVQGLNAQHGTNQWVAALIPTALPSRTLDTPLITGGTITNAAIGQAGASQHAAVWDSNGGLSYSTVSNTELNALIGITGPIQTLLDGKAGATNGTAYGLTLESSPSANGLTLRGTTGIAGPLSANGATLSTNELSYLDGVTSGIQAQLDALAAVAAAGDFRVSHAGLVTSVSAGTLLDAAGNPVYVAAQTVTNVASVTNFLVVTLSDLTVRSVRRAYHSGCVPLATLVAGASTITSTRQPSAFRLPADPVWRFKAKLRAGQLARVAVLGTSLMNFYDTWSGGTNVAFRNLLFSTTYSARGYNVTNAANVTQLDYSQGSTGPHVSAALLGRTAGQATNTYAVDSLALGLVLGAGTAAEATVVPAVQESPLALSADLVLVDTHNYGHALLSYVEAQCRRAADAGADIIIIGSGPGTADPTFRFDQGPFLAAMCRAHGWAFVDVNAFQRAAIDGGDTSDFVDGIHQSYSGNGKWAARVRDVLNDYIQDPQPRDNARFNTVTVSELGATYAQLMPELAEVLVNPVLTDGDTGQATLGSSAAATVNPLVLFGGKTSSTTVTVLNPGEYAVYGHPLARAWDLLVELNPTQTLEFAVKREGGTTTVRNFSATYSSSSYGKQIQAVELFTPAEVANTYAASLVSGWIGYTAGAFGNLQFRIQNTSATEDLRIIAPVCHTVRYRDVDNREWSRGPAGTWLEENAYWGGGNKKILGNDSAGASVRLRYHGRGIVVVLQRSAAGGQVSLVHDGATVTTDLYHASSTAYRDYLAAPDVEAAGGRWDVASREHALTITTTSVGSGGAGSTGLRRLALVAAYVIQLFLAP